MSAPAKALRSRLRPVVQLIQTRKCPVTRLSPLSPTRHQQSVRVAGDVGAAAADEYVEIGAEVGLLHVVDVQLVPPAFRRFGRLPGGATAREFVIAHVEMQPA